MRETVANLMAAEKFRVVYARGATEAMSLWQRGLFQLIVIDVTPDADTAYDLFRWLRKRDNVPVVMISAVAHETNRIDALELGADDFMAKPFHPRELRARILTILRRARAHRLTVIHESPFRERVCFGDWCVETSRRRLLHHNGDELHLTAKEYDLLFALMTHANRVLTRNFLSELVYGRSAGPGDRAIDVAVSRLRRKLRALGPNKTIIETAPGGYKFSAQPQQ